MKTMETYFQNSAQRPLCYGEVEAWREAKRHLFDNVVIFDFGTTGMFIGDLIKQNRHIERISSKVRLPSSELARASSSVSAAVSDDKYFQ